MNRRTYTFELVCPRCNKRDQIEMTLDKIDHPINCGDCLMEKMEIVSMTILGTTVNDRP